VEINVNRRYIEAVTRNLCLRRVKFSNRAYNFRAARFQLLFEVIRQKIFVLNDENATSVKHSSSRLSCGAAHGRVPFWKRLRRVWLAHVDLAQTRLPQFQMAGMYEATPKVVREEAG
jgi:hypothetical protein